MALAPDRPPASGRKRSRRSGQPRAGRRTAAGIDGDAAMTDYKNILLVVDLSEDSQIIGERAKAIAACYRSEITLLHVVEYVPVEPMGEALLPTVQIESELVDRARHRLGELAERLSLSQSRQLVETGGIKAEIIRAAQRLGAD